jgi:hypothetical protein
MPSILNELYVHEFGFLYLCLAYFYSALYFHQISLQTSCLSQLHKMLHTGTQLKQVLVNKKELLELETFNCISVEELGLRKNGRKEKMNVSIL